MAAEAAANRLPRNVARFLDRREECHHWTWKEPHDAGRAREIAVAVSGLDRERIDREYAALRKRYRHYATVIGALATRP
ncbi:MAG TPA: hypothetical protein VF503_27325 [Sphingobium sp.]|uniref:hypothetical protein n=1 Tax=Sphingobium sp. TaxID=1912891 RepID=UPI002ED56B2C